MSGSAGHAGQIAKSHRKDLKMRVLLRLALLFFFLPTLSDRSFAGEMVEQMSRKVQRDLRGAMRIERFDERKIAAAARLIDRIG